MLFSQHCQTHPHMLVLLLWLVVVLVVVVGLQKVTLQLRVQRLPQQQLVVVMETSAV